MSSAFEDQGFQRLQSQPVAFNRKQGAAMDYTMRGTSQDHPCSVGGMSVPQVAFAACAACAACAAFRRFCVRISRAAKKRKAEPCDDKAGPVWLGARDLGLVSALL